MKAARKFILAVAISLVPAGWANAQLAKEIPANALVALKVTNLAAASKKVADLANSLGLAQLDPDFSDPLTSLEKKLNITQGLNTAGDLGFVYVDPDAINGDTDKAIIILIPVSDYQTFLKNFPGAKTENGITQVTFGNEPDPGFVASWGDYAAVSPSKDLVSKAPEGLTISTMAAKEWNGKDFCFLANLKYLRPKMHISKVDELKAEAELLKDMTTDPNLKEKGLDKFAPVVRSAVEQGVKLVNELGGESDAATFSINLGPEGIATTAMLEFNQTSKWGKTIGSIKNTDASLLSGLSDTSKYLLMGGSTSDTKLAGALFDEYVGPISAEAGKMGDDGKDVVGLLDNLKVMLTSTTGTNFGMLVPTGKVGTDPLYQLLVIRRGDAGALLDASRKELTLQNELMQKLGLAQSGTVSKLTPDAKTVDGIHFDLCTTTMGGEATTPGEMENQQIFTYAFGPNGMALLTGKVNDKSLLSTIGISDADLPAIIKSAQSDEDPLAKNAGIKSVAGQLPKQRVQATYIALDQFIGTGLSYAKTFGLDMGVKLPDDLPPVGLTISTSGPAVRIDSFVPSQLMQAITSAAMQAYLQQQHGENGDAAPGGL